MKITEHKRNCPSCNRELFYTRKYELKQAVIKKSVCNRCSGILKTNLKHNKTLESNFFKKCSECNGIQYYKTKSKLDRALKNNQICPKCSYKKTLIIGQSSNFQKSRYSNVEERENTKNSVKKAMHRPEIRKKHLEGLLRSKWIKVRTDKGQLELIEKWNKLGFNFEPNYQVKTDVDLFYIDGYDKEKNVVLEYDSKYHKKPYQRQKDLVRQQKIIDILKPKKFWRFDVCSLNWRKA